MSDPDFVAQTAEPMNRYERHQWFRERAREFKKQGATWLQFSVDAATESISLVEGWRIRPDVQPPPHFGFDTMECNP